MSNTLAVDAQSLPTSQPTVNIPSESISYRSDQRGPGIAPSESPANNSEPARQAPGEIPARPPATQPTQRPPRSLLQRVKQLLGIGADASRTRKALVSLIGTLAYNFLQAATVIALLGAASVIKSPQDSQIDQVRACARPLVAWNSLWLVRLALSSGLTYWNFLRIRAADNAPREDLESTPPSGNQPARPGDTRERRTQESGSSSATNSEDPPVPYNHVYARLSLFLSMFTLTWFLTAHILEYTSINTCRLSAPLVWWLTFGILCTMYLLVLEVILFGLLVFVVLPFIMVFYSIVLLCLGRHPLQNPHYIKPDIGRLPKSLVDRIPLVMYIPPPPDDTSGLAAIPMPIHTYPPKSPAPVSKKRFVFFHRRFAKKGSAKDRAGSDERSKSGKADTAPKKPETWEDNWEAGEYPFVRLENNRAACAVCLMDFEEPKRLSSAPEPEPNKDKDNESVASPPQQGGAVEILVENITEEERSSLPRLEDAGEGAQPLRLLACGHAFHKTCIDPWLTDVSGRCPVCQRRVETSDLDPKKSKRRQRR